MAVQRVAGSFRDPAGFVFIRDGILYRQVNESFTENFRHLIDSGLYAALVADGLLIPHEEVGRDLAAAPNAIAILRPERVGFVSYPYEWSFAQLRDAALATLAAQRRAYEFGMSLRDASAYNVQFVRGKPVLIDTLSFERLPEGRPWVAYGQFCRHFLAPLALAAHRDLRLLQLLRVHVDGVPLDLAAGLLPVRTRLRPGPALHLHAHARAQRKHEADAAPRRDRVLSARAQRAIVESLASAIDALRVPREPSHWSGYYAGGSNYSEAALAHKKELVGTFLDRASPGTVWDLGANVGTFGRLAADRGAGVVCFDADPACVEENYRDVVQRGETCVLPLVVDLTNPSPAAGWAGAERLSLSERGPADLVMALALVHHLAIGNNVPLDRTADYFRSLGRWLIVEFVPKSDGQVQRMLASREDVFSGYTQEGFEAAFEGRFSIERRERVTDSERTLYLMRAREE